MISTPINEYLYLPRDENTMKINVLTKSNNDLRIEIIGESHTYCNALQSMLIKENSVEFSGYNIIHPLFEKASFYIRTKGSKKPEEALLESAKALKKKCIELEKSLKKLVH